eukprot:scpid35988/ scgid31418/ 
MGRPAVGSTAGAGVMDYREPTATFHTPPVLSPRQDTIWQRFKRFILRGGGRVQPTRRRAISRRQQRAEAIAAAGSKQSEWLPPRRSVQTAPAGGLPAGPSLGHRLRKSVSRSSLDGVSPTVREELENRWPKVAGVKPMGSLAESRNIPLSTSDTFLAMTMGSGQASDYDSVDGRAESEAPPNEGRPYAWMDAPVEGFDNFMMY